MRGLFKCRHPSPIFRPHAPPSQVKEQIHRPVSAVCLRHGNHELGRVLKPFLQAGGTFVLADLAAGPDSDAVDAPVNGGC